MWPAEVHREVHSPGAEVSMMSTRQLRMVQEDRRSTAIKRRLHKKKEERSSNKGYLFI